MNLYPLSQIEKAIKSLCPEIWGNIVSQKQLALTEEYLWEELVNCILSSQVKYELSFAVTQRLKEKGLLGFDIGEDMLEQELASFLSLPIELSGRLTKYRFPNIKAKQIATARKNIYGEGGSLRAALNEISDPADIREFLVESVPGVGMKQASMYLRNVRNSYDLAIIDTHVLNYMRMNDLTLKKSNSISKTQYLTKESTLVKYSSKFGYPVGCVDYAIWIVMRVARKEGYL